MYTALTLEKQLGGLLALSSWLPLHKAFPQALKWNSNTQALHCHGNLINFSYLRFFCKSKFYHLV